MPRKSTVPQESPTLEEAKRAFVYQLKGQRLSPRTIAIYAFAVDRLAACVGPERRMGTVTKRDVQPCVLEYRKADGAPASPATLSAIYRGLQSFFKWAMGEADMGLRADPTEGWRPPAVTPPVVRYPTDPELRALLATCKRSRSFLDARDEALLRVLIDTGCRLSEVTGLTLGAVDLDDQLVHVAGKRTRGRERPRTVPFGPKTAASLDRYINRFRAAHFLAGTTDALWLGHSGALTPNGVAQAVKERGRAAGLPWLHAHQMRHRFNAEHLRAGMQETDLMTLTGHTSRTMLDRYGAATKTERAIAAYRRIPVPEV
jgi:integrase/recombinase XerC